MICRLRDLTLNPDGTQNLTVTISADFRAAFDRLKGKLLDIDLSLHRKKRSLTANSFCWALCKQIGDALKPPLPKEAVYRKAIRDVGEYEPLPIRNDAVDTFSKRWAGKGTGWFTELVDDSKLKGYKLIFAYYGSSTYDTASMSRLIDYLVDEAEQMELTIPLGKSEMERLKSDWHLKKGD